MIRKAQIIVGAKQELRLALDRHGVLLGSLNRSENAVKPFSSQAVQLLRKESFD
jgi:hypothetical protein